MKKNFTVIALGSNLGDKYQNLKKGMRSLGEHINIADCSNIYESQALLPSNAPQNWDSDFYNCVLCGKTNLNIAELFRLCNDIEAEVCPGKREKGGWSPRYLDIDIIAFNDEIIETEQLSIPHKRMLERGFVILPLADILPDWEHPASGRKIWEYKDEFVEISSVKIKKLDLKL